MKIIPKITLIILLTATPLFSGNYIGVGLQGGSQNDVGNLTSLNSVASEPQFNLLYGMPIRIDYKFIFLKSGVDKTYTLSKGKILEDSAGSLEELNINSISIPLFLGVNIPASERGLFYIGMGGKYFLVTGDIKTSTDTIDIDDTIFGYGFTTGIMLNLSSHFKTYFGCEYLKAKSKPFTNISTTDTRKDFAVDLTGYRIHFGLLYYIF